MDRETISGKLKSIFEAVMDLDVEMTPDLSAKDVAEWDSLSHVRLIVTVEREFKVGFSAVEIAGLKNVGDLIGLIDRHINEHRTLS